MLIIYQTLAVLFGVLTLATFIAKYCVSDVNLPDLKPRLQSWWVILTIFGFAITQQGSTLLFLLCFISFMGFKEFISVIPLRQSDRLLIFFSYLIIPIQYILAWHHHLECTYLTIISVFLLLSVTALISGDLKGMLVSTATIYWGLILTTFCLSYLAYLSTVTKMNGLLLVVYLVIMTQLNDIAQYCWGKLIKGIKILPQISPNKTLSGLCGGIITSVFLSLLLSLKLVPFSPLQAIFAGLLISTSGFLGDVLMSAIKREVGVKDFSMLIPGHGGILDRIDSLTLTTPVFFYYLKFSQLI